ncbi:amidohydrolase family protein [Desulfurobacterium sp.]
MKKALGADYIIDFNMNIIKNGWLVFQKGKVEFLKYEPEGDFQEKVKLANTVIFPSFVNAHTHLELSLMNFNPIKIKSFFEWLLWIISNRQKLDKEEIKNGVAKGIELSKKWGTGFFGDISSFGISRHIIKNGIAFNEIIGKVFNNNASPPLSIHAVYSTSVETIKRAVQKSLEYGIPYQMHVGETAEEEKFVRGEPNLFESLIYPTIGRKRFEKIYSENIIAYLKKIGALTNLLVAVHCTNLSRKELEALMERRCGIVICPRSNIFLKTGFPDIDFLIDYDRLGIGTDGLSSNTSLSMLSEIKAIYTKTEGKIDVKKLLKAATIGGAKVLNIENTYKQSGLFTAITTEKRVTNPLIALLMDDIKVNAFDLKDEKVLNSLKQFPIIENH